MGRPFSTTRAGDWESFSRRQRCFSVVFTEPPARAGRTTIRPAIFPPCRRKYSDHNIVYEYGYDLVLGSLDEIRRWVYDYRPDSRPDYRFTTDREHWHCTKGDAGWPFEGFYRVKLDGNDPIMRGPTCAFRAEDVPTLYISAAYHLSDTSSTTAQLFWEVDNEGGFREEQSVRFKIIPDGEFHTYKIDFDSFSTYDGLISRLRFDPIAKGAIRRLR